MTTLALPGREAAWSLVCRHTSSSSLRRHMLAVEAALRAYAVQLGEDEELWGCVGLLHDFDHEAWPDNHPMGGEPLLAEAGWPEPVRRAILSHSDASGVARQTELEKALHACDELTGLIVAAVLVRPDRDLRQLTRASLMKKWRNPAFAAGVDRAEVAAAVQAWGRPLDEHIDAVLAAMQASAPSLGLAGDAIG
jgi:predicted hydrolase (HD superfamily)